MTVASAAATDTTRADCTLELANKVPDELEVLGVIEQLELHEGLVLSQDLLIQRVFHVVDRSTLSQRELFKGNIWCGVWRRVLPRSHDDI